MKTVEEDARERAAREFCGTCGEMKGFVMLHGVPNGETALQVLCPGCGVMRVVGINHGLARSFQKFVEKDPRGQT